MSRKKLCSLQLLVTDPHIPLLSTARLGSRVESISLHALMNGDLFPQIPNATATSFSLSLSLSLSTCAVK